MMMMVEMVIVTADNDDENGNGTDYDYFGDSEASAAMVNRPTMTTTMMMTSRVRNDLKSNSYRCADFFYNNMYIHV